uniref:Uncharacterized protein n=1 Tax=Tanacetum cinerariifolium TaxID=118510 RepID=A0A6L2L0Z0_TANCI|nr:hypothetical protein [Tanacetum cinerariifolium]
MEILLEPTSNKLMVTPTKPGRMTKPYSSHCFMANCFNAENLNIEVKDTVAYNKDPITIKLNLDVSAYRTEIGLRVLVCAGVSGEGSGSMWSSGGVVRKQGRGGYRLGGKMGYRNSTSNVCDRDELVWEILHSWSLVLVGTFCESPYWVNSFGKWHK